MLFFSSFKIPDFQAVRKQNHKTLYVIVEAACLEIVKVHEKYQLLNSDDHHSTLARQKRDPTNVRPDICHQLLLMLFDSILMKTGHVQVYIHTQQNDLIQIDSQTRIPRTFARFCGLMVQLLHDHKIRSAGQDKQILLKMIPNPVTKYIPLNTHVVELTHTGKLVDFHKYCQQYQDTDNICFVIGGFAHGQMNINYSNEKISISQFGLSAAAVAARLTHEFEIIWNVEGLCEQ